MTGSTSVRARLMVKVGTLYYIDGLSQQEISDRLGISRSQVSRLLTAARNAGVIEFTVHSARPELDALERDLEQVFGLQQAVVVGPDSVSEEETQVQVARAAAGWLRETVRDGQVLGVMSGMTLSAVAHELSAPPQCAVTVVPMIGGQGHAGWSGHANEIARRIATKFGGSHLLLNALALVTNAATREAFVAEAGIQAVLERAAHCDMAFLGVGSTTTAATAVKYGFLAPAEVEAMRQQGAVGHIGTGFFTADGQVLQSGLESRLIGLTLAEIKSIPRRVGVACGEAKAEAILGALRGGFITTLFTSEEAGRTIIRLAQKR